MLLEQSLSSTQEQLSQRVSEVVRHEQLGRKQLTELKTLSERTAADEEELGEQEMLIEKLRKDVLAAKEETHDTVQESMSYKQKASKLEVELEGAHEQEKLLNEQVGAVESDVTMFSRA